MNSRKVTEYLMQQTRLRQLEKQGRGDSEDAEYVREIMEDMWRQFSSEEAAEASKSGGRRTLTEG